MSLESSSVRPRSATHRLLSASVAQRTTRAARRLHESSRLDRLTGSLWSILLPVERQCPRRLQRLLFAESEQLPHQDVSLRSPGRHHVRQRGSLSVPAAFRPSRATAFAAAFAAAGHTAATSASASTIDAAASLPSARAASTAEEPANITTITDSLTPATNTAIAIATLFGVPIPTCFRQRLDPFG